MNVVHKRLDELIPYAKNARTHSDSQVAQIAASIREFGWMNPVLIDAESNIIAGHGRVLAARKLGLDEVPCVLHDHLTETQRKAYILADNKMALNAGWDEDMLRLELRELGDMGFDLELTGFGLDEAGTLLLGEEVEEEAISDSPYTRKIEAPVYEITGEKPAIKELYDRSKTDALISEIDAAGIPDEISAFLRNAAERHTVFNFRNIAEFYAHSDAKTQDLMEKSALVIIDFNKAIEYGFVKLTQEIAEQFDKDYPDER